MQVKWRELPQPAVAEALDEVAAIVTGLAMLTMVLFPLALPMLVLLAAAAVPLVAVGLVAGLLVAPIVLVRHLARRERTTA